jgi:hypothetical protein
MCVYLSAVVLLIFRVRFTFQQWYISCAFYFPVVGLLFYSACVLLSCSGVVLFRVRLTFLPWWCCYISGAFYFLAVGLFLYSACVLLSRSGVTFIYYLFIFKCSNFCIIYIPQYCALVMLKFFHAPQFYVVMLPKYILEKLVTRRQPYCIGHGSEMGLSEFSAEGSSCSE